MKCEECGRVFPHPWESLIDFLHYRADTEEQVICLTAAELGVICQ